MASQHGWAFPLLLFAASCAVASGDGAQSGDEDITAAESAALALAKAAKTRLYVRLSDKPAKELGDALVAAAERGVAVGALLPAAPGAGWDATWMLQQRLESSGVDTDVRADNPLADVVAFADDTALVVEGTATKKRSGAPAAAVAKRFSDLLEAAPSSVDGATLARGEVKVHPMPESKHDRIVALFRSAKTSIDVSIYQMQDRAVVLALTDAAKRHVAVRVMLEPKTVGAQNYDPVSRELAAGGVTVQPTPPRFDVGRTVDHAKFAIVDAKEILVATGNLVRSGLGGDQAGEYDNRDFWIEDARAASVDAAQALFEADWARKPTPPSATDVFVISPENAVDRIGGLLDGAKHRVFFYNQSLEDADLVAKLVAAKRRQADVRVLVGYQPGFGGPPKNQDALDKLHAAGIPADYLRTHYLHAKAMVVDDRVYIGSQNFTNGGLRANRELGLILDDRDAVAVVAAAFATDARR